jgi:hypothetical protein
MQAKDIQDLFNGITQALPVLEQTEGWLASEALDQKSRGGREWAKTEKTPSKV